MKGLINNNILNRKPAALLGLFLLMGGLAPAASAGIFVSGSTGVDGAFEPSANTVLPLPPDGVFHFTTVNIPTEVTVTFTKNAANTPVTILATGDVTINGKVSVNGSNGGNGRYILYNSDVGIGGPGGYNGGPGGNAGSSTVSPTTGGAGLGPGGGSGGNGGTYTCGNGGNATYAISTPTLLPLVGGSGGGGGGGSNYSISLSNNSGGAGGGGGGAILIASSGAITVNGSITADGGNGGTNSGNYNCAGGVGSGGAIRLIADTITGPSTASITTRGGSSGISGSAGRGRLEAFNLTFSGSTGGTVFSFGAPGMVNPPGLPTLAISRVGEIDVPTTPGGSFTSPDVALPSGVTNPVTVEVTAANIPVPTTITVIVTPQFGTGSTSGGTLSGTSSSSFASVGVNLAGGLSFIQVVTAPFTVTADLAPFLPKVDGEPVEKIRLAVAYGGTSQMYFITKSGKEVPAGKDFSLSGGPVQ